MSTLRSEQYWEDRARERMETIQQDALGTLRKIDRAYRSAEVSMLVQIRAMVKAFAGRYGISEEDAAEILKTPCTLESYQALVASVANMPDGVQKRMMMAELNAPSARYRISKTQAIREQTRAVCSRLADEEKKLFTDSLTKSVQDAYMRTEYDLQNGVGLMWETVGVSKRFVTQLLREDWSGASYRTRISGRYAELADELSTMMLEGFLGGRSRAQMEEELSHRFEMNRYEAKRLLVTETTYVTNAAQKQLYEDEELGEYRYQAVLDLKTSDVCQTLDGMVFDVKDAKVGKNYPPMHPNCRSTTIAVLDRAWLATVTRKALDPITGEVVTMPPNTSYKDWYKMMADKHGEDKLRKAAKQQA